jgi:hypothetical protein
MMILNDTYAGTFYWGKTRSTYVNDSDVVNGQRIYKRKAQVEKRPRSEWIAIPVPDSGIPPETIRMARKALEGNNWHNTQHLHSLRSPLGTLWWRRSVWRVWLQAQDP